MKARRRQSLRPIRIASGWYVGFCLGIVLFSTLARAGDGRPLVDPIAKDAVGINDFRISNMGTVPGAFESAVAYNSTDQEYLVIWRGDGTGSGSSAIYGQLLSIDGIEVGADFQISDTDVSVADAALAHNSMTNQYLALWARDDGQRRIYGQLLGADGSEIGIDFPISDNLDGDAAAPALAVNRSTGDYLVVWSAEVDGVAGELEIFGEILDAAADPLLESFPISDMGPPGNVIYDAYEPAVAWSSTQNEYLVVWSGDDDGGMSVDGEFEIYGQRLDDTGMELGGNDVRISDMGLNDGDAAYDALEPALVYNAVNDEYLVVWRGDDDTLPLVEGELEIFGQCLTGTGTPSGENDFRISDLGTDGDAGTSDPGPRPSVAYSDGNQEYMVVWSGTDEPLIEGEREIYMQRLDARAACEIRELGANDLRLSDMGPDGDLDFLAELPTVAFGAEAGEFLVVWRGDDEVDHEFEIFGQRFEIPLQVIGPGSTPFGSGENPELAFDTGPTEAIEGEIRVWQGDDPDGLGILARIYDGVGAPVGLEFQVNTYTSGEQSMPHLAYGKVADELLVVWQSAAQDGDGFAIAGRMMDADNGQLLGAEFLVNSYTSGDQTDPRVAYDEVFDEFMVVWTDAGRDGDGSSGVTGQRFDNGSRLGSEILIQQFTTGAQRRPSLASNSNRGEFMVVWESEGSDGDGFGIAGHVFIQGKPLGIELMINTETTGGQHDPDIAFDESTSLPDGTYLVVWRDDHRGGKIPARRIRGGKRLGIEFQVGSGPVATGAEPRVGSNSEGVFTVLWEQLAEVSGTEIVGQMVASEPQVGEPDLLGDQFLVSSGDLESSPAIAFSGAEGFTVVWEGSVEGVLPGLHDRSFIVARDLNLRAVDSPDPVGPGQTLSYTVSAINDGPGMVTGVVVESVLPAEVTPISTTGCQESVGVPTCTLDLEEALGIGDTAELTIHVLLDEDVSTTLQADFMIDLGTAVSDPDVSGNTVGAWTSSTTIFLDGFESGDFSQWTMIVP